MRPIFKNIVVVLVVLASHAPWVHALCQGAAPPYFLVKKVYREILDVVLADCVTQDPTTEIFSLGLTPLAPLPATPPVTIWSGAGDPNMLTANPFNVLGRMNVDNDVNWEGVFEIHARSLRDIGHIGAYVEGSFGGFVQVEKADGTIETVYVTVPFQPYASVYNIWNAPTSVTLPNGQHFNVDKGILIDPHATDPDGGAPRFFEWQILARPPGSTGHLTPNPNAPAPTLRVSKTDIGNWQMKLRVADAQGQLTEHPFSFVIDNRPPDFKFTGSQTVKAPTPIHLTVGPPQDLDGEDVSFRWDIVSAPPNARVQPTTNYSTATTVNIPTGPREIGTWQFRVTATDEHNASVNKTAQVTVVPTPPTISIANKNLKLRDGATIRFETTELNDAYGQPLNFSWSLEQVPISAGINVSANYGSGAAITVAPPLAKPGSWRFKLTVTDAANQSVSEEVMALIDADPIAVVSGPSAAGTLTQPLNLNAAGSSDPDSPGGTNRGHLSRSGTPQVTPGIVGYRWTIKEVPDAWVGNRYHPGPVSESFHVVDTAPQLTIPANDLRPGDWLFELEVTDHEMNTARDAIWVEVIDEGTPPLVRLPPFTYFMTDVNGLALTEISVDGSATLDLDNLLTSPPGPGLGITNYQWDVFASAACSGLPAAPSGATASRLTLFPQGTLVFPGCYGVTRMMLTVTDDDTPSHIGVGSTAIMIGNCAGDLCIDYPTELLPQSILFTDQTDVLIYYHLNAALYAVAALTPGLRVQLQLTHESQPNTPVFDRSWDLNLLPSNLGGLLVLHWAGYTNGNQRPLPGRYSTRLQLTDANGVPVTYAAVANNNIKIQTVDVEINSISPRLNLRTARVSQNPLTVNYQVTGQAPGPNVYDQIRFRVYRRSNSTLVWEQDVPPPFNGQFTWLGLTSQGFVAPGEYDMEVVLYKGGATLGKSARRPFSVFDFSLRVGGGNDVAGATVFLPENRPAVSLNATTFPFLKYSMRPVTVLVENSLTGSEVELAYVNGDAANIELFGPVSGGALTLPQRWTSTAFTNNTLSRTYLAYGKEGDAAIKLTYRQGTTVLDEQTVMFRAGHFPGVTGVPLQSGHPYFHALRTSNAGEPIRATLDPLRHADRVDREAAVYVVAHKTPAQWAADPTLRDVSGGTETVRISATSIAVNVTTAAAIGLPGDYDVVYDFGPASSTVPFATDGRLDPGDILDMTYAGVPSVTVEAPYTAVGTTTITTIDYGMTPGTFTTIANWDAVGAAFNFRLRGRLVFPSPLTPNSPLVVFVHGMHTPFMVMINGAWVQVDDSYTSDENFRGYTYLQEPLARRGFVTLSVDLDETVGAVAIGYPPMSNAAILLRSWLTLKNIELVLSSATLAGGAVYNRIDPSRIYLVGHSRGGEAVITAPLLLSDPTLRPANSTLIPSLTPASIKGIVSLAPVVLFTNAFDTPRQDVPFLLLQGSADGDVDGGVPWAAPFRHYDRASGDKIAVRLIGGNHNHFNTTWAYDDARERPFGSYSTAVNLPHPADVGPNLLSGADQREAALGYINAFLGWREGKDPAARAYFEEPPRRLRPAGIKPATSLELQSRLSSVEPNVVDDYEWNDIQTLSSSTGPVTFTVNNTTEYFLLEAGLHTSPENEPHNRFFQDTRGVLFDWTQAGEYVEELAVSRQDWRDARALRFRVAQQPKHANTLGAEMFFTIELEDAAGATSAVSTLAATPIPDLYPAEISWGPTPYDATTAAFNTIRLPRAAFEAGGRRLDWQRITRVRLKTGGAFGSVRGRIALDDWEVER